MSTTLTTSRSPTSSRPSCRGMAPSIPRYVLNDRVKRSLPPYVGIGSTNHHKYRFSYSKSWAKNIDQHLWVGVAKGVGLRVGIVALDSSIKGASKALNMDGEVGAIENEQNTSNGLMVVNNDGESSMFPTYFAIGTTMILLIMLCPCLVKGIY